MRAIGTSAPVMRVMGVGFSALTTAQVVRSLIAAGATGEGLWVNAANSDSVRRCHTDPVARDLIEQADIVVADGTPLVWASRIAGSPLPERVAGSDMMRLLSAEAAKTSASLFLLGGDEGTAMESAAVLSRDYPGLRIAGTCCPPYGFEHDSAVIERIVQDITEAQPTLVLVALGFPKQDIVIAAIRDRAPGPSYLGVGAGFSFIAGHVRRAPAWTHKTGLEWLWRLLQEPRRLVHRYLVLGVPFAGRMLASAMAHRARVSRGGTSSALWGPQP